MEDDLPKPIRSGHPPLSDASGLADGQGAAGTVSVPRTANVPADLPRGDMVIEPEDEEYPDPDAAQSVAPSPEARATPRPQGKAKGAGKVSKTPDLPKPVPANDHKDERVRPSQKPRGRKGDFLGNVAKILTGLGYIAFLMGLAWVDIARPTSRDVGGFLGPEARTLWDMDSLRTSIPFFAGAFVICMLAMVFRSQRLRRDSDSYPIALFALGFVASAALLVTMVKVFS